MAVLVVPSTATTRAEIEAIINSASAGDTIHIPLLSVAIENLRIGSRNWTPPVTIYIHPLQKIGIRLSNSQGVHLRGGWLCGAGSDDAKWNTGLYATTSSRWTYKYALLGSVASQPNNKRTHGPISTNRCNDYWVSHVKAYQSYSDPVQFSGDHGQLDIRYLRMGLSNSRLWTSHSMLYHCEKPGGVVDYHLPTGTCSAGGGVWKDSSHPDGHQFFGSMDNYMIRDNWTGNWGQGMGRMGAGTSINVWLLRNSVMHQVDGSTLSLREGWAGPTPNENHFIVQCIAAKFAGDNRNASRNDAAGTLRVAPPGQGGPENVKANWLRGCASDPFGTVVTGDFDFGANPFPPLPQNIEIGPGLQGVPPAWWPVDWTG